MNRALGRILAAVCLLAPCVEADETPPAAPPVTMKTAQSVVILWESTAAQRDCAEQNGAAMVQAAKAGIPLSRVQEPEVCEEATVAKLTRGTEVKVLPRSERCGDMAAVEVQGGRNDKKTGCIIGANLAPVDPPKEPATAQ